MVSGSRTRTRAPHRGDRFRVCCVYRFCPPGTAHEPLYTAFVVVVRVKGAMGKMKRLPLGVLLVVMALSVVTCAPYLLHAALEDAS